jgi:uncharacterized membrane protein YcjF (UPF0283 family)
MDFNQNDCIKPSYKLGSTTYVDICTNQWVNVTWETMDWVYQILSVALVVAVIALLIKKTIKTKR